MLLIFDNAHKFLFFVERVSEEMLVKLWGSDAIIFQCLHSWKKSIYNKAI